MGAAYLRYLTASKAVGVIRAAYGFRRLQIQRVVCRAEDLEIEALKLGIPVKTRHNEVAPNQFELAPIFEECNLANDHNLLIMSLMRKVSRRHGFRVLLHEKPFKGVNGSGKHNNWSLGTDTGILLMGPGKTPEDNLRFVTFVVNTLMAVYHHNGLLPARIFLGKRRMAVLKFLAALLKLVRATLIRFSVPSSCACSSRKF